MSNTIKDSSQAFRIVDALWYQTIRKPDFYENHPEAYLEVSHYIYRTLMKELQFFDETRQDYDKREQIWRGQFRIKVVHNIVKDYELEPELVPTNKFTENPEYIAIRYTALNGRVRYTDWELNDKSWM